MHTYYYEVTAVFSSFLPFFPRASLYTFFQVISQKDQPQYWFHEEPHSYISVDMFCEKFRASQIGKSLFDEVSQPPVKTQGDDNAISFSKFSLPKGELFKACLSREFLLMKRNSFIYIFKIVQVIYTVLAPFLISLLAFLLSNNVIMLLLVFITLLDSP